MADQWTDGLRDLDPVATRKRLADLIFECNHVADGLDVAQGTGLRDHVSITRQKLEQVAKSEIARLAAMLAEYRSGPPAAAADPAPPRVTPPYDAARARAEAKAAAEAEPAPAPAAPTRPQMPMRGARLPKLLPGRPA